MYPGERRMVKYDFKEKDIDDLIAFFKWIGEMNLQGWPPKPTLVQMAVTQETSATGGAIVKQLDRPKIFNQMCIACHSLQKQGGSVGPALDEVGDRRDYDNLVAWLTDPQAVKPGAKMPKLPLSHTDITELAAFLSQLKAGK
jgi:nitric oxide reductase subunit C